MKQCSLTAYKRSTNVFVVRRGDRRKSIVEPAFGMGGGLGLVPSAKPVWAFPSLEIETLWALTHLCSISPPHLLGPRNVVMVPSLLSLVFAAQLHHILAEDLTSHMMPLFLCHQQGGQVTSSFLRVLGGPLYIKVSCCMVVSRGGSWGTVDIVSLFLLCNHHAMKATKKWSMTSCTKDRSRDRVCLFLTFSPPVLCYCCYHNHQDGSHPRVD